LRDDPTIALRFEVKGLADPPPTRLTLRLRGTAFDSYNGRAWERTLRDFPHHGANEPAPLKITADGGDTYAIFRSPDLRRDRVISFDLEAIDPPVIFLPSRAVAMRIKVSNQILLGEPLTIQPGAEDEYRYTGSDARGLRYDVYVAPDNEPLLKDLTPSDRARYLALPVLPERIAELAHRWTDAISTSEGKASAIEDHLRREFIYDLHSSSQGKPQPVDHFLFESKRGHCEFFSTALALMLRMVGIPSRNVTGFVGGTWNRFGRYYAVREGDAHSWVEAYIDDARGWRTFDPTPPSGAQPLEPPDGAYYYVRDFVEALSQRWNTYVVGYDLRKQVRLFDEVSTRYQRFRSKTGVDRGPLDRLTRGPSVAGAILAALALGYVLWRRRRKVDAAPGGRLKDAGPRDRNVEVSATLYRALETALQLHGVSRAPSLPPLRHAEEMRSRGHPLGSEAVSLTTVYLEARFGGTLLSDATRRDFERRVRDIRAFRRDGSS